MTISPFDTYATLAILIRMNIFLVSALSLAMLAVLATLVLGVVGMARGGDFNQRYGNRLMRLRIVLQGVALLLFALALLAGH